MFRRSNRLLVLPLLLASGAAMFSACDDDPRPSVIGTVTLIPDDSLLVGVELVLVDAAKMALVAGPVRTDAKGFYSFDEVPSGRFYPIPLFDQDLQLDRSRDAVVISDDRTVRLDLRAIRSRLWDAVGLQVSGAVRDSSTKEPLPGALLSLRRGDPSPWFEGITLPSDAFTDSAGRFVLEGVPADLRYGTTLTILVTRPGYLPQSLRLPLPAEPDSSSLRDVEIDLVRGAGGSAILGRVVRDGEAVAGVPVILDWYRAAAAGKNSEKAPLLGFSSTTDAAGWYRFEGLSAGSYTVAPGYLPDDGYFFNLYSSPQAQFELTEAERDTVADLSLGALVQPILPLPGSAVIDSLPKFLWSEVAGADRYEISFAVDHLFGDPISVDEASYRSDRPLPDGVTFRWYVYAFRDGEVIGGFDQIVTFDVDLSPRE